MPTSKFHSMSDDVLIERYIPCQMVKKNVLIEYEILGQSKIRPHWQGLHSRGVGENGVEL